MKFKKIKKIVSLFLVILMLLLTGCAKQRVSEEDSLRVVGTVGEFEVSYGEFRFVLLSYMNILTEAYGEDIFDTPESANKYADMIWEHINESITVNYAVLTMCREVGIEMTDPALERYLNEKMEEHIKSFGGKGAYIRSLNENYMTDSFFRFNVLVDKMQNELFYVYVDDLGIIERGESEEDVYKTINENFIRTQHVYISKTNGKSCDENQALIEEAHKRLQNGEDFISVVNDYGEDNEMKELGIYITKGYMSHSYEDIAFELTCGKYSDIVEDENGFYIIKRLDLDTGYVMLNMNSLFEKYQKYTFLNMINETQKTLKFTPNDYLKSLDIFEVK